MSGKKFKYYYESYSVYAAYVHNSRFSQAFFILNSCSESKKFCKGTNVRLPLFIYTKVRIL